MSKFNNKGQTEIFGLVIIVILLAIGLLFAIVILTKTPTKEIQRVKESVQAANFLNTIMSTTSPCAKKSVRQLLQDCALANEDWTGATYCGEKNTCQIAEDMITVMLSQTLGKWGKQYYFYIEGTPAIEKIKIGNECKGEREGSTRPEKVNTGLDIQVTLHICS